MADNVESLLKLYRAERVAAEEGFVHTQRALGELIMRERYLQAIEATEANLVSSAARTAS